ncbi:MAG: hypothetical protein LLG16_04230 [Euryarchaeota archaeon]|nr:hypothetical protein [Euryarchaeota archaeon]
MDHEDALKAVENKVRGLPGVIDFIYLDADLRENIVALESACEKNGACGGLMPYINTGVWETLRRQQCFVLIISSSAMLLGPTKDLVYIADKKGQVIGEYLTPERREEFKERTDVSFLGEDFILYMNVEPEGEPFFVLPEMPFDFLKGIDDVIDVTSASISTLSDDYIRDRFGYKATKHWTHLVGFNLATKADQ